MDDAAHICARLLTAGHLPRTEFPPLDHPTVCAEVEERLGRCGLGLATTIRASTPPVAAGRLRH